jgi:hypothetical protein
MTDLSQNCNGKRVFREGSTNPVAMEDLQLCLPAEDAAGLAEEQMCIL